MLRSIPFWPPNVVYTPEGIHDQLRRKVFALNPTGHLLVQQIDGRKTLTEIAQILAEVYNLDLDTAAHDVRLFFLDLNRQLLINFKNPHPRWPAIKILAIEILTMLSDPAWAWKVLKRHSQDRSVIWKRSTINLHRPLRSLAEIVWLIFTQVQALWLVLLLGTLFALAMLLLYSSPNLILSLITIATPIYVVLSNMMSLAIHEMGHALIWYYLSGETQVIVAANKLLARVICPAQPFNKEAFVALGGPAANVLLSCISVITSLLFRQHLLWQLALWLFAAIQGIVGVRSLLGSDGRKLWRAISKSETATPFSVK